MIKSEIYKQILNLTSKLIEVGLSVEQNFPSEKNGKIYISGDNDLSIALKNIEYSETYKVLNEKKNYNFKLIDGGLIQLLYQFSDDDELVKSRLAFFPSPNLDAYQNDTEVYDNDDIYADIIGRNIVTTPIRIDYDPSNFVDLNHPKTHFTIGSYKNCRIPISNPLTPNVFVDFILRSFYNTVHTSNDGFGLDLKSKFELSITTNERKILHLNINSDS